ncbi:hypothetical protein M426DRAFT_254700 [Hypoxylon sp. CI-4A]|nr:hypothetical protein M426DRAFT_254700 [Hypoxylon sp. CI-4A]
MRFLIVFLFALISQAVALSAGIIDINSSSITNLSQNALPTASLLNRTVASGNVTLDDPRFKKNWHYNDDECKWVIANIPYVNSECTEYCEADTYDRGYYWHHLKYHIKITGNGQDTAKWCDNFKARMMSNCAVEEPAIWSCNSGPLAPEAPELRIWAIDQWASKVVQKPGINIRFDFSPKWEPRDAEHDCVSAAIREATCEGTVFSNGLRCIPTLWRAPDGAVSLMRFVEISPIV